MQFVLLPARKAGGWHFRGTLLPCCFFMHDYLSPAQVGHHGYSSLPSAAAAAPAAISLADFWTRCQGNVVPRNSQSCKQSDSFPRSFTPSHHWKAAVQKLIRFFFSWQPALQLYVEIHTRMYIYIAHQLNSVFNFEESYYAVSKAKLCDVTVLLIINRKRINTLFVEFKLTDVAKS